MSGEGRILIVDNDPDFAASYREFLTAEGYAVDVAASEKEARMRFEEPGWDLIVIDQKLRGPRSPDEELDLAVVAMRKAPEAKVIIATAYAEPASIARAFDLGVYDYLQKDQFFEVFLRAKVRNAMEVWRERALAALSIETREQELAHAWKAAQMERDPRRTGEQLERIDDAVRARARSTGAEEQWVTPEGYTQLPREMREDLGLQTGGHLWFLRSKPEGRWQTWRAAELDQIFGLGDDASKDA